jgi:hypothetical protein
MTSWDATPGECRALAKVLHLIRLRCGGPEWHMPGIEDALLKARLRADFPDLAIAAVRAARETNNRPPAVIGMDGPHGRGGDVTASVPPPDPWLLCVVCGKTEDVCRSNPRSEHTYRSRRDAARAPELRADARDAVRRDVREALAAGKALLCPHGARRGVVPCKLCDNPSPEITEKMEDTDDRPTTAEPERAPAPA